MRRRAAALVLAWLAATPGPATARDAGTPGASAAGCAGTITAARYAGPTDRYDHGILGDAVEWGQLRVTARADRGCPPGPIAYQVTLPDSMVFEDTAPRLADVTGDGRPEVIVVETALTRGARLAVWGLGSRGLTRLAQTPHIGRSHRWLAPLGAADLDGDGRVEIAYVDRPHLARILRIWRFDRGRLVPVAEAPGLTNHRIGDATIAGGLRNCRGRPEIVTVNADWSRVRISIFDGTRIATRDAGPFTGTESLAAALACR